MKIYIIQETEDFYPENVATFFDKDIAFRAAWIAAINKRGFLFEIEEWNILSNQKCALYTLSSGEFHKMYTSTEISNFKAELENSSVLPEALKKLTRRMY